ncbi:MAG: TetR/AcrR family transcriptional regulator [Oscillospiraceae bacterium]|nr:TetR/AcrR family transcriptional regulator [Oscillospiraceae bacterium]
MRMNNTDRNTYVKVQILNATVSLLAERDFEEISVSEITERAQVSRNSFYRNYESKEDILLQHVRRLLGDWRKDNDAAVSGSNAEMFGSLFQHLSDNREFYMLLRKRNLFHLFLDVLLEQSGPKPEMDNTWAYITAFIVHGTYGWIEEWVNRGMQDSGEEITGFLTRYGMK